MEELGFGLDLVIVLIAAMVGGIIARRARLPILVGYLIGGIIIGPYGFSLVRELESVNFLGTLGVILLLFTLGLEFSLKELMRIGKVAILGGIVQILLTATVGIALGRVSGWVTFEAIFFGFTIALSSTVIVLKTLMERGELDTEHGHIMIGILLVQDLSVVVLMIVLPALGGEGGALLPTLGIAALKAAIFMAVMLALGIKGLPLLMRRVAGERSTELFVLTIVTLGLAAAAGTYFFGLSAAFGAFVAGLLISQSVYARQALANIVPLRDTFAAIFFVSLGMLADPRFAIDNALIIAMVVVIIIFSKFAICFFIPWFARYSFKTSFFTGMGLIQIGEFSFILAMMGISSGIISEYLYSIILVSTVITMFLTPFAFNLAPLLYQRLSRQPRLSRLISSRVDTTWESSQCQLSGHIVICGYGSVGSLLAKVLERRDFPYFVIDLAPQIISELHSRGISCVYGDASNPEILAHAQLDRARALICTFPDYIAVELTARNALNINPKLDIVARVHRDRDIELLKGIGVAELVRPEFEASLEITRHTLHRLGLTAVEIQHILTSLREGTF